MKVQIGKYPSRLTCEIYSNYMRKKHGWNDWPDQRTKVEKFLEKLEDFVQTLYTPINYFLDKREQKVKIKIDNWDTWSMDYTMSLIIVPMLKQLKETKHGAPFVSYDHVPENLRATNDWYIKYSKNGETDPYFFERWDWVMDEMIWAFTELSSDNDNELEFYEWSKDAGDGFLGGHKLVNVDQKGLEEYNKRIDNGLRLFGKYYRSLWD